MWQPKVPEPMPAEWAQTSHRAQAIEIAAIFLAGDNSATIDNLLEAADAISAYIQGKN